MLTENDANLLLVDNSCESFPLAVTVWDIIEQSADDPCADCDFQHDLPFDYHPQYGEATNEYCAKSRHPKEYLLLRS